MGQTTSKSEPVVELKGVVIGDHNVGKSSLLSSFLGEKVRDDTSFSWVHDEPATVSNQRYSCLIFDIPTGGGKFQKSTITPSSPFLTY